MHLAENERQQHAQGIAVNWQNRAARKAGTSAGVASVNDTSSVTLQRSSQTSSRASLQEREAHVRLPAKLQGTSMNTFPDSSSMGLRSTTALTACFGITALADQPAALLSPHQVQRETSSHQDSGRSREETQDAPIGRA
ncbi:hypothetical protein VTN02DRAFT_5792 [Thermoascus thermophilus]